MVVGGKTVPAGSYTIFTVPDADKWTLIINKKTGEWGIPYKYESDELARVDMKVSKLPVAGGELHHRLRQDREAAARCAIDWETTRASVDICGEVRRQAIVDFVIVDC